MRFAGPQLELDPGAMPYLADRFAGAVIKEDPSLPSRVAEAIISQQPAAPSNVEPERPF